jgi:hypothetical protein
VYKKNTNKWWDGYGREEVWKVVLEDFPCETGNLLGTHMKVLADRATFLGEVKCGTVVVEPGRFILIVASNYPMERCFTREEDLKAMKRRFREIEMTKENKHLIDAMRMDSSKLSHKENEVRFGIRGPIKRR